MWPILVLDYVGWVVYSCVTVYISLLLYMADVAGGCWVRAVVPGTLPPSLPEPLWARSSDWHPVASRLYGWGDHPYCIVCESRALANN